MNKPQCTCLTAEEPTWAHAFRCDLVAEKIITHVDGDNIRELAELAANSDIDTARAIYRNYLARTTPHADDTPPYYDR